MRLEKYVAAAARSAFGRPSELVPIDANRAKQATGPRSAFIYAGNAFNSAVVTPKRRAAYTVKATIWLLSR